MITLPKPLSARAQQGMPQRRRKSGLRTAAGSLQEQFLDRLGALADDPTLVLPECPNGEPRTIAKLRRQLMALKAGRTPLAARFDVHVLGAVHKAMQLAEWEAVPRMLDAKIAGQRRFYVQRGQVKRTCSLGVQNYDQPRVLLLAYSSMAQRHGLHFFALEERVACSGKLPQPPAAWFAALAGGKIALTEETPGHWGCGHADRDRIILGFRDGPDIAVCGPCGERVEGLHRRLRERYLGPAQRKPVEVTVRKADGAVREPTRESVARYRAGMDPEATVLRSAA